jgi:hypothetical protein
MDGVRIQLLDQFVMNVSDAVVHVVDGALHCRRIVEATFISLSLRRASNRFYTRICIRVLDRI